MPFDIPSAITSVTNMVTTMLDKAFPDADQAQKNEIEKLKVIISQSMTSLKGGIDIVLAEAQGESYLQRNWRPLIMIEFGILIGLYWLGFSGENLPESTVNHLLQIVQYGLSGYVVGRSGEKIMKEWKK